MDFRDETKWKVYVHTSPSGKMYVGITSRDVRQRWRNGRGYIKNDHFYRAIQKYGWDNFDHEVIAENLTKDEACEMEKTLIKELKSNDYHFGYNLSAGGEGSLGLSGFKSPTFIDLTGQRFGKLTVLKVVNPFSMDNLILVTNFILSGEL